MGCVVVDSNCKKDYLKNSNIIEKKKDKVKFTRKKFLLYKIILYLLI